MAENFYRGVEAEVVSGSAVFAARIAAGYAAFGLSAGQAAWYGGLDAALQAAYPVAVEPGTRTRVAVAVKNEALRAVRAGAALLARVCRATPSVSDGQLIELGLRPRAARTPIAPPSAAPIVIVGIVRNRRVDVRLRAAGADPSRRARAAGAKGCNLYTFVGPTPPADPRDWRFEAMATRTKTQIEFPDNVPGGAIVWLSARWVTARGATGPASAPVAAALQGGPALPLAA